MGAGVQYEQTTCSQDAFQRGSGQKALAFSFYSVPSRAEKSARYFKGVKANLDLLGKLYTSDWNMRLYHDLEPDDPLMEEACSLACNNTIIDLCPVKNLPHPLLSKAVDMFPMNWRFFPTLDPQVDVYHCRDLDSRFSQREVAAVQEFMSSGLWLTVI